MKQKLLKESFVNWILVSRVIKWTSYRSEWLKNRVLKRIVDYTLNSWIHLNLIKKDDWSFNRIEWTSISIIKEGFELTIIWKTNDWDFWKILYTFIY